jgi:prevent-host-death family protein
MLVVDIDDAKARFSRLIERVERGEEIVIGRSGKPVAKLVPYEEARSPRTPGGWEGRVTIASDFDELPPELTAPDELEARPYEVPTIPA